MEHPAMVHLIELYISALKALAYRQLNEAQISKLMEAGPIGHHYQCAAKPVESESHIDHVNATILGNKPSFYPYTRCISDPKEERTVREKNWTFKLVTCATASKEPTSATTFAKKWEK